LSLPFLTVVVPTYNRRRILERTLPSLLDQTVSHQEYEIVVVVDGSSDGTREMLQCHRDVSRLRIVFQQNRGLAAARNRGAEEARGAVVLFLDDDMIAARDLVAVHRKEHSKPGQRVVFGALGLAGGVRRSFLKEGVEVWGQEVDSRLRAAGYRFGFDDCHFGHASISRSLFSAAGAFDESFTRFGNEDYDLGWRLILLGSEMRYSSQARVWQVYDKSLFRWLRDSYCVGLADVALERKHPSLRPHLRLARRERHPLKRLARRSALLPADPLAPAWGLAATALAGLEIAGARGRLLGHAQSLLGERQYWRGVRDARRVAGVRGAGIGARQGRVA
jgi:glycosyltransferase involved in cell wall biosynthesis